MLTRHTAGDDASNEEPAWFLSALKNPGQSAFVMANGVRLHSLGWALDDASKPLLLLMHGFRSHAHWWDWTAPYLATHYRVVAPDLSGMGDSAHRQSYEPDTFAEDVIGYLDAMGLPPAVGIGHSYGGSTLLRACVKRPDLFSRLILLDTCLTFQEEATAPQTLPRPVKNTCYPSLETAMARFVLRPRQPSRLGYLLQHIARHSARQDDGGWRWKFDPAVYPFDKFRCDADALLARVQRPVDYIRAECSSVVNPARAQTIARLLPQTGGKGVIEIPDTHHHMMLDQPIALIATLRAMLRHQD
jgi:pimeloyl-ACP methyl ester carboxylesterase